ncbi:ABC transporter substrate-binding protein [Mycobacterium sp. 236(2023)]|uniref:ABC transporter substrate-binding protein n=1 Tax=Mycobacterium sp. 236(2023) TaxID=3038163 RepID=UPI0024157466|nr:ABC transporter substrate-binding protein [Mycobacterium sp. 236(2023)]MDG4663766.1 ABC transporter substrate-binding protein [Mycobacterium sp. 236(2023)]
MKKSLFCALSASALLVAGCSGPAETTNAAAESTENVIRFTFSPDPAWDWMQDQGILEEMEQDSGYRILQTITWDEFGQFVGGHADVISIGSYELQNLEQETGIKTVTFGKFNYAKDVMITANPEWETAADLPKDCKIAAESVVGNALIWQALVDKIDNRELAENGEDLNLVTADYQIIPSLVQEGEVCAAFADPTQSIPEFASGKLNIMYDGKSASELYGESISPGHKGVMSNLFVARKDWYDTHKDEAAFFLSVWQRALDEWAEHREEIIDAYPEHFAVASPEEAVWMKAYFGNTFDWFVDSPYLDQQWIDQEKGIYGLLKDAGVVNADTADPEMAVVSPQS